MSQRVQQALNPQSLQLIVQGTDRYYGLTVREERLKGLGTIFALRHNLPIPIKKWFSVGTLNENGQFQIRDLPEWGKRPLSGDLFNSTHVSVDTTSPAFKKSQWNPFYYHRAKTNAITPWVREEIHGKLGNTGQGVTILLVDEDPQHIARMKAQVIGKQYGLAPGVDFQLGQLTSTTRAGNIHPDSLENHIIERFQGISKHIRAQINQHDGQPTVIAIPQDISVYDLTKQLMDEWLGESREEGEVPTIFKEHQQQGFGTEFDGVDMDILVNHLHDTGPDAEIEVDRQLLKWTRTLMSTDPNIQAAYADYVAATQEAQQHGIWVVVSSGNAYDALPRGIEGGTFDSENWLGKSPAVITVAASDTNQTPDNMADDKLAEFSGLMHSWYSFIPFVPRLIMAAPGNLMPLDPIPRSTEEPEPKEGVEVVSGTSISALVMASILALCLHEDPTLDYETLRVLLRDDDTVRGRPSQFSNDDLARIGLGFVNPVGLVQKIHSRQPTSPS